MPKLSPQPEIVFRHGACSASIFENKQTSSDGEKFAVKSVHFQKAYRDENGEWQHTSNLRVNDIPKAVLVLNKAYDYLTSGRAADEE